MFHVKHSERGTERDAGPQKRTGGHRPPGGYIFVISAMVLSYQSMYVGGQYFCAAATVME